MDERKIGKENMYNEKSERVLYGEFFWFTAKGTRARMKTRKNRRLHRPDTRQIAE